MLLAALDELLFHDGDLAPPLCVSVSMRFARSAVDLAGRLVGAAHKEVKG
jgi:hypothetical protein